MRDAAKKNIIVLFIEMFNIKLLLIFDIVQLLIPDTDISRYDICSHEMNTLLLFVL